MINYLIRKYCSYFHFRVIQGLKNLSASISLVTSWYKLITILWELLKRKLRKISFKTAVCGIPRQHLCRRQVKTSTTCTKDLANFCFLFHAFLVDFPSQRWLQLFPDFTWISLSCILIHCSRGGGDCDSNFRCHFMGSYGTIQRGRFPHESTNHCDSIGFCTHFVSAIFQVVAIIAAQS